MNQPVLMFLLLWSSGPHLASAVYVHSPEEVVVDTGTTDTGTDPASVYVHSPEEVTVNNGTTGRACGVPAIKPKVPGCPRDGLGIINGEEAVPHSWPWQVSMQTNQGFHFCGGSLINKDWVVTAAHCGISRYRHRVILGQHNLKETYDIQSMRIGQVFIHPDYQGRATSWDYDITLIKLQSPAQMNKHVSPVCVVDTGDNIPAGTKCVVTGWGSTRSNPVHSPAKLQQACLPAISHRQCKSYWGRSIITKQMFCAGAAGTSTCQGDSGGPLVCKKNGAWTLYGLTSWGRTGCPTNGPGVYTFVPNLRAWMDRTMANN